MGQCFSLEIADDGLAVLTFDQPDAKVNTLSGPVLGELEGLLGQLEAQPNLTGLVLRSGKPGQFIAGADLNELASLAYLTKEQGKHGIERGLAVFQRFSDLPFPTIALVDGPCMGGGTEWILSLDERLCSDNPKTTIALPEVKIGIIPGWGGTQRLPRLIGVPNAISMITTGEPAGPKQAVERGLAFDAVPAEQLLDHARHWLTLTRRSGDWPANREQRRGPVRITPDALFFAAAVAEGQIAANTKGHYPAPMLALRAIEKGCGLPLADGLEVEKQHVLELMGTTTSANLIAIFFMTKRLERDRGVEAAVTDRPINKVGVLGAGLMGAGIAAACARRGVATALVDVDDKKVAAGLEKCVGIVKSRIDIGRARPEDMVAMLSRLSTGTQQSHFADADVVVEAIVEHEGIKKKAYQSLAPMLRSDAILASNTSTISITKLAEAAPHPERFVGMHFFNPVDRMALVEVIRGQKTDDATVAAIVALAKRIGKTPIVVKDGAGFLVNRILFPYMTESLALLLEGATLDQIDQSATKFGMPMGPILLHDVVGLDTAMYAGGVLAAAYPDRAIAPAILQDLVAAGRLGQKTGAGFRKYSKGGKGTFDPSIEPIIARHKTAARTISDEEVVDRLFLPMLFEAVRCVAEQVVRTPADVDMGLVLGIGFPPFRGGILRWCDEVGADAILSKARNYSQHGPRFQPPALLQQAASSGQKFYPRPKHVVAFGG